MSRVIIARNLSMLRNSIKFASLRCLSNQANQLDLKTSNNNNNNNNNNNKMPWSA